METRLWAALGAMVVAGSICSSVTNARVLGGMPSRPVPVFRGFQGCSVGVFCRHGFVGGVPSAAFRVGFPGRSAGGSFAGGPSDDYAVDVNEGFGTDDAFRFDRPAAPGPGNESRRSMPDASDSYDPDAR